MSVLRRLRGSISIAVCLLATSVSIAQPPVISDPDMMAPVGSMPGTFPSSVTAANFNAAPIPGSDLGGTGSNNILASFPSSGPIAWTESRHNEGDVALLIGPFDPTDASYFPPNSHVDDYKPLADGQPFANTTLGWRVNQQTGALMATVRNNGVNNQDNYNGSPVGTTHGIAYFNSDFGQGWGYRMTDGVFANGGDGSSDLQMGFAGSDAGNSEAVINTAVAYFPYAEGWQGAWVNSGFDGPGDFSNSSAGLDPNSVNWSSGVANVTLAGVDSATDGMLFVAPTDGGNDSDIASAFPTAGGWNVTLREDNNTDVTGQTYNDFLDNPFQFLYVPYSARNVVGGLVDGGTGATIQSAGDSRFSINRTQGGEYAVSVFAADGTTKLTGDQGTLMLSVAASLPGSSTLGDRKFMSYEYDAVSGDFIVQSRELVATSSANSTNVFGDDLALRDVDFYFTFVDFANPLSLGALSCDFDGNGTCDIADIDALVMEVSSGGTTGTFDLNGDGSVDPSDITAWLAAAGEENLGAGRSYIVGDADLDGVVDVSDFNIWNSNKFNNSGKWSQGDFSADGFTDVSDFNLWNGNKFTSSDTATVPEPNSILLTLVGLVLFSINRRRSRVA